MNNTDINSSLKNMLNDVANQLLDLASDYDDQDNETMAYTIGGIAEELSAITQVLDNRIRIEAPFIIQGSTPSERIAALIQTLRRAAAAVEPENDEIAVELARLADELESLGPITDLSRHAT